MPKNPGHLPLSLVSPATTGFSPTRKLGPHGLNLWKSVQAEYAIADCGGRELLAQACEGLDRAEELKACIDADGPVIRTRSGIPRAHPACKDEISARTFVVRTLQKLGLNYEPVKTPGRPTTPIGWIPPGNE
jgi:hypothetical protein